MSDMEFDRGDNELFTMMACGHGPGGEFPHNCYKTIQDPVMERAAEIDRRVNDLKRVWPVCIRLVICLAIVMAVAVGWVHPVIGGCMEFVYLLQVFFAWRNIRKDGAEK